MQRMPTQPLSSRSRRRLDIRHEPTAIHVAGEIDIATADEFEDVLVRCERDRLVHTLDLSGVRFFSAAGIRCFAAHGWSRCPHPAIVASPPVRKLLDLCGLEFLLARHGWRAPDQCSSMNRIGA